MKILNCYGVASLECIQSEYKSLKDFLDGKKSKKVTLTGALICIAKFGHNTDDEREYLELYTDEDIRLVSYSFEDIDLFKKISSLLCVGNGLEATIEKDGKYAKISEVKEKD